MRLTRTALGGLAFWLLAAPAEARPTAPRIVCDTYPEIPECAGRLVSCDLCHISTWPADWNPFGIQLINQMVGGDGAFEELLPGALLIIESQDADADGASNIAELEQGSGPGDSSESWPLCGLSAPAAHPDGIPVPAGYDLERAFRRVNVLYCGKSPSYAEMTDFSALDSESRYMALHAQLSVCLDSSYWHDEALPRLADWRIRPIYAVGADSPVGITIGDYEWDYRLFSYVMTGDRDVRDLLLADYHVDESGQPIPTGQALKADKRAGMITTEWFFAVNTMFSTLPRTTAAQAYRAYLGADIAKLEGIDPVAGEPLDVDDKGVAAEQCAVCHSTLDPLSYAFAAYEGIKGAATGTYNPARVPASWGDPQAVILGAKVDSVTAWAAEAANSEMFMRTVAAMLFRHAIDRDPLPDEQGEFEALFRALPEVDFSANRIIHLLVDTRAFGAR